MSTVGQVLATVLWLYWVVMIVRLVLDFVQVFAPRWHPRGVLLLGAEAVFTVTDPPLKALRRIIPPVRVGQVQFDLGFLIILIGLQILITVALGL